MICARSFVSLACFVLLAACGDPQDSSSDDTSSEDSSAPPQVVELDDALMERYLAIHAEMVKAGEAGTLGLLTRHGWTLERWTEVSGTVTQGMISAMNASVAEGQEAAAQNYDTMIAELEKQHSSASAEQATALRERIDEMKRARTELTASRVEVSDLDRRNAEVLKRWMPRLQAAPEAK